MPSVIPLEWEWKTLFSFCRLVEECTSSTSGSSIVFEKSDCSKDKKAQAANTLQKSSDNILSPAMAEEQMSQVHSTKILHNSHSFVPCAFLGELRSVGETCPALRWENSTLFEESYVDMSSEQMAEKHPKEVCCSSSPKHSGKIALRNVFISSLVWPWRVFYRFSSTWCFTSKCICVSVRWKNGFRKGTLHWSQNSQR